MTGTLQFSLFTVFPFLIMSLAGGVSAMKIWRTKEFRLVFLVVVLVFMTSHQLLEGRTYLLEGTVASGAPEWFETSANTFASVAVYYGTELFERERRLAERLQESENRYRTLTEHSPLPILVGRNGAVVYANEAAMDLFGAEMEGELTDRQVEELFRPEDRDRLAETVAAVVERGEEVTASEERVVGADGDERFVLLSATRADYEGDPSAYLVLQDVTEERKARRELESTRRQLETTLESSNDAIFLIDPENDEILDANSRAAELVKYDREELVGLSPDVIHPHEVSRFQTFVDRVYEEGGLVTDDLSCRRKDGVEVPAEVSASTTTVNGRKCVLASVRDTSERERQRQQVDVLSRVLRHNLRNDMTIIVGQAGFIESHVSDDRLRAAAERIQETATSLVNLSQRVRDLQSVVRSDGIDADEVSVRPVVEGVVSDMRVSYPDAEIGTDVPGGMTAKGTDREALAWALSNLVENAVEHNDSDSPRVDVSARASDDRRGDWIQVEVADNGPGIPEHERTVAIDPEEQTELSHATGIGLWIVGQVVEASDGDVSFRDREGGGTVVTLHLRGTVESKQTVRA